MNIDHGRFLPTMDDAEVIGPSTRAATLAEPQCFDRYAILHFEGTRSVAIVAVAAVALAAR